jgi:hypothetical protein
MSGGQWNYQQHNIDELASEIGNHTDVLVEIIKAAAQSEHIIDWAESGDTVRRREDGSGAERDLYDLWLSTFRRLYE